MEDISDSILIDKEVTRMFNKDVLYEADFDKVDNILISNVIDKKDLKVSYIILDAKEKGLKSGHYEVRGRNIMKSNNGKNYYTIISEVIKS